MSSHACHGFDRGMFHCELFFCAHFCISASVLIARLFDAMLVFVALAVPVVAPAPLANKELRLTFYMAASGEPLGSMHIGDLHFAGEWKSKKKCLCALMFGRSRGYCFFWLEGVASCFAQFCQCFVIFHFTAVSSQLKPNQTSLPLQAAMNESNAAMAIVLQAGGGASSIFLCVLVFFAVRH